MYTLNKLKCLTVLVFNFYSIGTVNSQVDSSANNMAYEVTIMDTIGQKVKGIMFCLTPDSLFFFPYKTEFHIISGLRRTAQTSLLVRYGAEDLVEVRFSNRGKRSSSIAAGALVGGLVGGIIGFSSGSSWADITAGPTGLFAGAVLGGGLGYAAAAEKRKKFLIDRSKENFTAMYYEILNHSTGTNMTERRSKTLTSLDSTSHIGNKEY